MPPRGKSEERKIEHIFPSEYKNIYKFLQNNDDNTEMKNGSSNDIFIVHPEHDLYYKLVNLQLGKKTIRFSNLYKISGGIKHKEYTWIDYMFQIPGIEKILGVKREYTISNIEKIFQSPILFLFLFYYKDECLTDFQKSAFISYSGIIKCYHKALECFKNRNESNEFDREELEICSLFFLEDNIFNTICKKKGNEKTEFDLEEFLSNVEAGLYQGENAEVPIRWNKDGSWNDLSNCRYNKRELEEILAAQIGDSLFDREGIDKGYSYVFPIYMRTIFIGIGKYYKEFPFTMYEKSIKAIWSGDKRIVIKNVDNSLMKELYAISNYIDYRYMVINLWNKSNWDQEYINDFVKKYYSFCIKTLFGIFQEKEKYKDSAQHAFEKIYSLFYFNEIINLLINNMNQASKEVIKQLQGDEEYCEKKIIEEKDVKNKILKVIFDRINSEHWNAIYCAPGIFHRIHLAKYIIENTCNIDILVGDCVVEFEFDKIRVDFQAGRERIQAVKQKESKFVYREFFDVATKIEQINYNYEVVEEYCVEKLLETEFNLSNIDKSKICETTSEMQNYEKFYENIKERLCILSENGCEEIKKGNKDISKCKNCANDVFKNRRIAGILAREILGRYGGEVEMKLFFGVILSSFIPNEKTKIPIKIE